MKRTTYYLFLGLITFSLIGTTACNSSKKTGKKKKYSKKCGTCPTWGQINQKNSYFSIIDEEKA